MLKIKSDIIKIIFKIYQPNFKNKIEKSKKTKQLRIALKIFILYSPLIFIRLVSPDYKYKYSVNFYKNNIFQ